MTTKERTAVQNLINKMTELDAIMDETLEALKQMNEEHGDGSRYCSWKHNLDGVIANTEPNSTERGRAFYQYDRYMTARAQQDLIREFGGTLADLGFWEKK